MQPQTKHGARGVGNFGPALVGHVFILFIFRHHHAHVAFCQNTGKGLRHLPVDVLFGNTVLAREAGVVLRGMAGVDADHYRLVRLRGGLRYGEQEAHQGEAAHHNKYF